MYFVTMIKSNNVKVNTIGEAINKFLDEDAMSIWDDKDNCILTKFNTN